MFRDKAKQRAYNHKYYLEHQEQRIKYNQQRQAEYYSRPEVQKRRTEQSKESHARGRTKVLSHYSNGTLTCLLCGFSDVRALCIDHIEAVGTKNGIKEGGGRKFMAYLLRNNLPNGYRVLCANCNLIREIERRKLEGREVKTY